MQPQNSCPAPAPRFARFSAIAEPQRGPPPPVFELDMLFLPLTAALRRRGALAGTPLAVSSNYHPYFFFGEMEALFRWLSWRAFGRPLHDFTLDGAVGQAEVQRFCDALAAEAKPHDSVAMAARSRFGG